MLLVEALHRFISPRVQEAAQRVVVTWFLTFLASAAANKWQMFTRDTSEKEQQATPAKNDFSLRPVPEIYCSVRL